ncbi:hypothetical protein K450DRAFT_226526 [Umbelopsis ramanniana AG]|uniref:RGS domain-containing protein n=1 Tax=Umbelopsis ramanniana AG TaxID=1314678 RepID=A0AAD5EF40_UMBRA|nr:uncharacterized protein K450DRAFT_226526 [Umbelopsis ramanniana AG]KAI8582711.1 hypothetical protein K450DRAFT_226526 [Umbelopsis ramanniana AG]
MSSRNYRNDGQHQAQRSTMKITRDGRPFTKDLHDLYSALMIQMPMDTHRVLFRSYPCTFTTDEAISNLGNLKFSHSLRSPKGSKESSITTTTTTFSMTREMAKTLLTQFLEARLFMNASDPSNRTLKDRGVWQVTPKGLCMLEGFVDRSVVDGSHLNLLYAHVRPIKVIQLERAPLDDALMLSRASLTRIIKTMMGVVPITPSSSAGNISLHSFGGNWKQTEVDYRGNYDHSFAGLIFMEWMTDYTTVIDTAEAEAIGNELLLFGWMEQIVDEVDRKLEDTSVFKSTKYALYRLTQTGKNIVGWSTESTHQVTDAKSTLVTSAALNARQEAARLRTSSSDISSETTEDGEATLQEMLANDKLAMMTENQRPQAGLMESTRGPSRAGSTGSSQSGHFDMAAIGFSGDLQQVPKRTNTNTSPTGIRPKHASISDRGRTIDLSSKHRMSSSDTRSIASSNSLSSLNDMEYQIIDGKDSNHAKLRQILEDPHIRHLFREHLKANFCEENICFWMDYHSMRRNIKGSITNRSLETQKELIIEGYQIYSTYVAPGSSRELNIDHILRQEMDQFISSISTIVTSPFVDAPFQSAENNTVVLTTSNPANSLRTLIRLLDKVDDHVYRLMAQDSVPKFIRSDKYKTAVGELESSKRDSGNGIESKPGTPASIMSDAIAADRQHKAEYTAMRSAMTPVVIRTE